MRSPIPWLAAIAVLFTSARCQQWPDQDIKEPRGFLATSLERYDASNLASCQLQIIFQRDMVDTKHDFQLFAIDEDKEVFLPSDASQSLCAVDSTAAGQLQAYIVDDVYTLVPFTVNACPNGRRKPFVHFRIAAVVASKPSTGDRVWSSPSFWVKDEVVGISLVPREGVEKIRFKREGRELSVTWTLVDPRPDKTVGYFIMIRSSKSKTIITYFHPSNQRDVVNRATLDLGVGFPTGPLVGTVVVYTSSGLVTNPRQCPEVHFT